VIKLRDKHPTTQVAMARDWAAIYSRRAVEMTGTPEGAEALAHHRRYTQLADALATQLARTR